MMAGYGVDRGAAVSMRVRITFARGKKQQFDRRVFKKMDIQMNFLNIRIQKSCFF